MKIHKLKLRNFRSHASTDVGFSPGLTMLGGPQGTGKSSCVYAIDLLLLGRTPNTARDGKGMAEHIRRGTSRSDLRGEFEFNGAGAAEIGRTISPDGQTVDSPWGKGTRAKQALLLDKLGVADEAAECLLDPRLFADRSDDERRQVLLKLLRQPTIDVPEAAKAVGIQTLSGIQQVDDQIDNLKTGTIRSLNAVIKNLEETMPAEVTGADVDAANATIASTRALAEKIGELTGTVSSRRFALESAERHVAEIEAAATQVQDIGKLRAQAVAAQQELKIRQDEVVSIRPKVDKLQSEIGEARGRMQALRSQGEALARLSGKCPTCMQAIDADAMRTLQDDLEGKAQFIENHIADLQTALTEKQNYLREESLKGQKARQEYDLLTSQIRDAERLEKIAQSPRPDVEASRLALSAAEDNLAAMQARAPELEAQADAARDTLSRYQARQDASVALSRNLASRERYRLAVEALEKLKVGILEGEGARKLEADANAIWKKFYPGCAVALDPARATVADIPVAHLSSGQKVILDVALRIAAARHTGFNLFTLDDANKLAPATRAAVLNLLATCGCQVIVCTTSDKTSVPNGVVGYSFSSPGVEGPSVVTRV